MSRIIAYCGLVCSNCPAFLATKNDDDAAREKTAAFYAKEYGFNLKPKISTVTDVLPWVEGCSTFVRIARSNNAAAKRVWKTVQFAMNSLVKYL